MMLRKALLMVCAVVLVIASGPVKARAADELNCILCHKFVGLSRVDETGKFRLFYINEKMFKSGPHGKLKCYDCHRDINQIPHLPAQKVDCTMECHIIEPSGGKRFTHKSIEEVLNKSVHSKYDEAGNLKKYAEDYPYCKDCHEEPIYRPLSFVKGLRSGISERAMAKCRTCHRTGDFVDIFYVHVTSRLHKTRTPKEIVGICAKCHENPAFQERHKLDDVVSSYWQTFHGKAVRHGSEETPDCVDCHVVYGQSVHLVEGKKSPTSAVNKANIKNTCRSENCHVKAGEMLAGYQVHVTDDYKKYPMQNWMLFFFTFLTAGVMYFFIILIFLELLRRLFPNFSFNKEERHDDEHKH